jgi:hypothetical protein
MADGALDIITNIINSPPGQLAAGGVLAGIVWKFFERVESVLKEGTKKEIVRAVSSGSGSALTAIERRRQGRAQRIRRLVCSTRN